VCYGKWGSAGGFEIGGSCLWYMVCTVGGGGWRVR
jgi:hypothetical protein